MAKSTKNGIAVLLALGVITLGLHACYRANAQPRGTANEPVHAAPPPWAQPAALATAPSERTDAQQGGGPVRVTTLTDRTAVMRDGNGTVHVEVSIDTAGAPATAHVPSDMVVIVDRSGSMEGQKLEYAKRALRGLIARLQPDDRFGLVEYDNGAAVRIPLAHVTDGARASFLRSVDQLDVGGGTNMSEGLDMGIAQMLQQRAPNRSARVLLLSDGLANQGDSSLAGLTRRAKRAVTGEFVLSAMGIGNDFNETVMTSIANAGTGAFYYLAKLDTLPAFLDAELKTAKETYAQAAQLRFHPAAGVRVTGVSGVLLEQRGDGVVIPLGGLYTGQKRSVWLTLQIPTGGLRDHELGQIQLSYRHDGRPVEHSSITLPAVASVDDAAVFRDRIVQPVWERATIEAELSSAQEQLATAIGTGDSGDVDRALAAVPEQRRMAQQLGNRRVLDELVNLEKRGTEARRAQAAPAAERSAAAKRESAEAFSRARPSAYKNIDANAGY